MLEVIGIIALILLIGGILGLIADYHYKNERRQPQPPSPELLTYSTQVIDAVVGSSDVAILNTLPSRIVSTQTGGLPCVYYATTCDENAVTDRQKLERSLAELTLQHMVRNLPDYQQRHAFRPVMPCIVHWQADNGGIFWACVRYAVTYAERMQIEAVAKSRNMFEKIAANEIILPLDD